MTRLRARILLPLLALAGLLIAGCGSSSSSSSSAAPAASNTAAQSSTSTAAAAATTASAPAASSGAAVMVTTKHSELGTILAAGGKKLTVYLFEADHGTQSSCSGECVKVWPPVLGSAHAAGAAVSANLGTTKRSDGASQVTYKGHPLYYFIKDKDDEDAYGQGSKAFGAGWYVLKPSGAKIDES